MSDKGQSLEIQLEELQKAGCERVFAEKESGTSMEGRKELEGLLTMLRDGDQVFCTRLDRLARSIKDLINIIARIEEAKATLHLINQPFETASPAGRLFIVMLGSFAQFEHEIRRDRQREGIAAARAALKYRARPRGPSYDREVIWHMRTVQGMKPSKIAQKLGATEWTIRRALKEISALKQKDAREEMEQSVPGGEVVLEVDGSSH